MLIRNLPNRKRKRSPLCDIYLTILHLHNIIDTIVREDAAGDAPEKGESDRSTRPWLGEKTLCSVFYLENIHRRMLTNMSDSIQSVSNVGHINTMALYPPLTR